MIIYRQLEKRKELKTLAITLKAARVNKNLTQAEAAKLLGISKDSLWNYENGRSFPDVRVIKKMEEVYELSYDNLIFLPNDNG